MYFIDFFWHFNDDCAMFDSRKQKTRSYPIKKFAPQSALYKTQIKTKH